MPYCVNCGTQMPDDARFCEECGCRAANNPQPQPAGASRPVDQSSARPPKTGGATVRGKVRDTVATLVFTLVVAGLVMAPIIVAVSDALASRRAVVMSSLGLGLVDIRDVQNGTTYIAEVPDDLVIYVGDEVKYRKTPGEQSGVQADIVAVTKAAQAR